MRIWNQILTRLAVPAAATFIWASIVVGFFSALTDIIQFFRYSRGFPENDFTGNLMAGIIAFLMFGASLSCLVALRRLARKSLIALIALAVSAAFMLAYFERPEIGSAVRKDLFVYLGSLGFTALALVILSGESEDEKLHKVN